MAEKIATGIELLHEVAGAGAVAAKGDVVIYNARIFLRRGDEVTQDASIIAQGGGYLKSRTIDGVELIDHVTELGKRRSIPGIEKALYGMRTCGYREVLVSPHLAYREKGVPGIIPENAMLRIQLWVREIRHAS
ncbi:MAG: FKBP-type peptidyl-prolyl cis-trans isomerase [Gammaproteobacteria bacterium]